MELRNENMIPIAIVTGYLGAGKTTLLNRVLNSNHGMRIAVLVNDFGSINIDTRLIVGVEGETITLSNGCICCTIRDDLVSMIDRIVNVKNPPDYIIIETSGVSDPTQVLLTLNRSILRKVVGIDSIIAVIDSEQVRMPGEKAARLIREQIRLSDIVILNKADLVSASELASVRQWAEGIIDKARIFEAEYCDVPVDSIIDTASYNPQTAFDTSGPGVHAHNVDELHIHNHNDHSLVFATWAWQSEQAVILNEIRRVLDNLPRSIFRAKGIIFAREIPDKQIVLQLVGRRVVLTEGDGWGDMIPGNSIVLIGDIPSVDKRSLQAEFEKTIAQTAAVGQSSGLVDGVMKWLRIK